MRAFVSKLGRLWRFLTDSTPVLAYLKEMSGRFYTFIGGSTRFMFAWDADLWYLQRLADDIRLTVLEKATV